jgi:hypothetical protein
MEILRKNLFFDFAVKYHRDHPEWKGDFVISDKIFSRFKNYLEEREFDYDIEGSRELNDFLRIAERKSYKPVITNMVESIKAELETEKIHEFDRNESDIRRRLLLELAEKYYGKNGRDRIALQSDNQVLEASRILKNARKYQTVLSSKE